jgi:hypothetical protein
MLIWAQMLGLYVRVHHSRGNSSPTAVMIGLLVGGVIALILWAIRRR